MFDYAVSATERTPALAVTGFSLNEADVYDIAGSHPDLSNVSAVFSALQINETSEPACASGGITRPELHFDSTGHILLDAAASASRDSTASRICISGVPPGTPYPPVPDLHALTGTSSRSRCWDDESVRNIRRGVWVPAFAGTTAVCARARRS